LLRAGTMGGTAGKYSNSHWNQKHDGGQSFHGRARIIKRTSTATPSSKVSRMPNYE
jgi:hypothetical protein